MCFLFYRGQAGKKTNIEDETSSVIERHLELINEKLNNMLTKSDTRFLKQIIKDTISEQKEDVFKQLMHRIEIRTRERSNEPSKRNPDS